MKRLINSTVIFALFFGSCDATNHANKVETKVMNENLVPDITLNNGVKIPQLGLGTYRLAEGEETYNAVLTALKSGYRHIDTAHAYRNERSVGRAIKDSGIDRKEIWVTSKLWPNEYGAGKTLKAIDRMLKRLGLDYIDLLYIHQPMGNYAEAWKEIEQALKNGKVRATGFCNFDVNDELFNLFLAKTTTKPQILQIECHPYAQREHWHELAAKNNIKVECWFPLGGRESGGLILRDPVLNEIAAKRGKSVAQIILRWHMQQGFLAVPGASNPQHIKDNISIFDFSLTDDEMSKIDALNKEDRVFKVTLEEKQKNYSKIILED